MIKRLIRWMFKKEFEDELSFTVSEARACLKLAKDTKETVYTAYRRYEPGSREFLWGIQPLVGNPFVVSWLNEHKNNCLALMGGSMVHNDSEKVLRGMAQVILIDSLLRDLENFGVKHAELLAEEQQAKAGVRSERISEGG